MADGSEMPSQMREIAALTPQPPTRLWQSRPHPTLPLIAVAAADKTARTFSLSSFQQTATVSGGHKRSVRSVAWKPSSGPRGVKRRYPFRSTDENGEKKLDTVEEGKGESVLVTGSFDASAGIWRRYEGQHGSSDGAGPDQEDSMEMDLTTGKSGDDEDEWQFAVVLDGHDSEIKCVGYSPIAPFLATCSRDKSVWIWEEMEDDNFETVAVLQEHEGDVKCIAWHPEEVLVASGSYDDTVRLWKEEGEGEDWACAAVLDGFGGTVWGVEFEPAEVMGWVKGGGEIDGSRAEVIEERMKAGPRLLTCSDDARIRIFRRVPKAKADMPTGRGKMPSILRTGSIAEEWIEEAVLPAIHERAIYAVSWSRISGRIVSCGSDGKIVVYEEEWEESTSSEDVEMQDGTAKGPSVPASAMFWRIVAEAQDAHDVSEVNHITWAPRADKGRQYEDEEVIVSTGDGGDIKIWTID